MQNSSVLDKIVEHLKNLNLLESSKLEFKNQNLFGMRTKNKKMNCDVALRGQPHDDA